METPSSRPVAAAPARPAVAVLLGLIVLALATLLAVQAPARAAGPQPRSDGFFAGRLINPRTGNPVKGVTVKVFRINTDTMLGSDVTDANGHFRIGGLAAADEELDFRANGSAVDYATGWFGCAHTIVATFGDACTFPQGRQGSPFKIRHL